MEKAPCSAIIHDKDIGAITSGTRHCLLHELSFAWYNRVSNVTTPPAVATLRTRAIAGKLLFANPPTMLGTLTNTLTDAKLDDELDTLTHAWSPTIAKPPSSHTRVTGSFVTRFVTSDEVFGLTIQADNEGTVLGKAVGIEVGLRDGPVVGLLVGLSVGNKLGAALGADVGTDVGDALGVVDGTFVGVGVGNVDGPALGTTVGDEVGDEVGEKVSELNTALQIKHARPPTCSPTDIMDTVSAPCTVSSFTHWSSCKSKLTPVNPRSTGRIATKVFAVTLFTVPYIAGTMR